MRDFLVFGFRTRTEFDKKSARSYDNERRRLQSYLGDLVSFKSAPSGKRVFISLDGRSATHNPLYKAFKAKSFTDKDITLHFILLDILADGNAHTMKDLLDTLDEEYLFTFDEPLSYDESTIRKKLKEYVSLGIVNAGKNGRLATYSLAEDDIDITACKDMIRFFSEENPLGVIGSYLEDRLENVPDDFIFKNHYIMNAYDSEIIESILQGIHERRFIEIENYSRRDGQNKFWKVIPLKVYAGSQDGRNYLMCRNAKYRQFLSYRIDYIQNIKILEPVEKYDGHMAAFERVAKHIWGVVCNRDMNLQHLEMDLYVEEGEEYILKRLVRERRCGDVRKIDPNLYRFEADVYSAYEMVPWIRTFIGRIVRLECDDPEVTDAIRNDIRDLAAKYEVAE